MGESKYNPTAIAAKKGELPPKPTYRERKHAEDTMKAVVLETVCKELFEKSPTLLSLIKDENIRKRY